MTFTTIAQIESATTKELVEFYNEHNSEKKITKFSDRATAVKRCVALYEEIEGENAKLVESDEALIAKVAAGIQESNEILAAEQAAGESPESPDAPESTEEKDKDFIWPFSEGGVTKDDGKSEVDQDGKPKTTKPARKLSNASNSAGVAASWIDPEVAKARLTRNGVTVTVNGVTTEHKSTRDGFRHYRLMQSKHIRFRGILKAAGSATYTEKGVDYVFTIIG